MSSSEKRSQSSSSSSSVSKRIKLDTSGSTSKTSSTTPSPAPVSNGWKLPTRGTEWVRLPTRNPENAVINDLILKTTRDLARIGKRLVHAPRLLVDGLIFDWVLDFSAKDEDVGKLLTIKGVDSEAMRTVLGREALSRSHQAGYAISRRIELMSGDAGGPNTKHKVPSSTGSGHGAGDPICIDIDIDNRQNVESTASKRDVNEDMEIATVLASHSQAPPSIDQGYLPSHKASIYPWNSSPGRHYISQHTSLHSNHRYHARHCDSEDEPIAYVVQSDLLELPLDLM